MDPKTPPSSPDSEKANTDVTAPAGDSPAPASDEEGKVVAAGGWNSQPVDDKPAEGAPKPEESVSPSAPESNIDIPAAIPPASHSPAATPAAPAWPADTTAAGGAMPASALGGAHKAPSKKGLLIGLIIALVVLVLGGGVAAGYFGYILPNKPENVLKAALVNSFMGDKVKSEHFDGKLSVKDKESGMTIAGTFKGGATSGGAFEVKADVDAVVTKVNFDVRSVDGSSYYLKVGGLEGLPELLGAFGDTESSAYAPIIASLNNQWIEINESILSQLGADAGSLKMTQADRNKIADAYAGHRFLSVQEKLKNEKVSGMDSYHFKVAINKAQLKDFMVALKDAKLESLKVTQDDISSFNDSVKNIDFNKYPIDVWVTKDTKLIDQVTFIYSDNEATLNLRLTTLDFNKPVNVTKPSGAKSLLEVISQLYSGVGGNSPLMRDLQGSGISL